MSAALPPVAEGQVLSGRFRLERPLGSGATAAVWAARDLDLGRPVALKLLLADGVEPELATRFEHEGVILGRLRHPNLVRVVGTGNDRGRRYLVMELVDGTSLDQVLHDGPLPPDEAVALGADLAAGLGAAHAIGVVHRDVKPSNVVCDRDGTARLVDFGIARAGDLASVTVAGSVLGTAAYLSPEQATGDVVGPQSDVYSLGCLLYELLTGRPPFVGGSALTVAQRHVRERPARPSSWQGDVPAAVEGIVLRCLGKDPADRYATAPELEADLRAVLAGAPPACVPVPAAGPPAGDDPDATTVVGVPESVDRTLVLHTAPMAPVTAPPLPSSSPGSDQRGPDRALRPATIAVAAAAAIVAVLLGFMALASGGDAEPARELLTDPVPATATVAEGEQPVGAPTAAEEGAPASERGSAKGKGRGKPGKR